MFLTILNIMVICLCSALCVHRVRRYREQQRRILGHSRNFILFLNELIQHLSSGELSRAALEASLKQIQDHQGSVNVSPQDVQVFMRCWKVCEREGIPTRSVMEALRDFSRHRLNFSDAIKAQLSGAMLTVYILLGLPLVVLLGAEVSGQRVIHFLLSNPLGSVLITVGVALNSMGVLWSVNICEMLSTPWEKLERKKRAPHVAESRAGPRIHRKKDTRALSQHTQRANKKENIVQDNLDAALMLDILLLMVQSGKDIHTGWTVAVKAINSGNRAYNRSALIMEHGAVEQAWDVVSHNTVLKPFAEFMMSQGTLGASVVPVAEYMSQDLRLNAQRKIQRIGERVMVLISAPLTLCFLPGFMVCGLGPVIATVAFV